MSTTFATQTFTVPTQVPQSLPELMRLYKEKERDAALDLTGELDYRTRPGLEIRKNGATQALPGLRAELFRMVEQNAGAIFLSGTPQGVESFVGEAQDLTEGAIVILSAKEMYTDLAKGVERGIRTDRRFSMDTLNSFVDSVMKLLDFVGVETIPNPNLTSNLNKVFPDTESLVQLMRESLNSMKAPNDVAVGDGLNAIFLQQRAAEEAIKEEISTPYLPVIVLDCTPQEAGGSLRNSLFFGRNVDFEAKEVVGQGQVVKVFKELKQQHPKGRKASK
jgi:hypothetical protein